MKNSRIIFFAFFWWAVLTPNTLNTFNLPTILDYLDEILQLILTVYLVAVLIKKKEKLQLHGYLKYCFILYLVSIFISYLFNSSGAWNLIQFLIIYYRPVIIILYTVLFFNIFDLKLFLTHLSVLFIIQIVLNFAWITGINPIPHWKHFIDISTGTFESVMPVAYFCIFILYFVIGARIVANERGDKNKYFKSVKSEILFSILVLIQLYITFTSHAIILGCIAFVGFLIYRTKHFLKYLSLGTVLFVIIVFSFQKWESEKFHASTGEILNPENIFDNRVNRLAESIKLLSFYRVVTNDIPEIESPLLGAGPGRYASFVASRGSDLFRKYNDAERLKKIGVEVGDITSVTGRVHSGALALLGDIGWLGYVLFISMLFFGLFKTVQFIRSGDFLKTRNPEIFLSFVPAILFYFLLDIIWDMGAFKIISIGFWVWFGLVMQQIYKAESQESLKQKLKIIIVSSGKLKELN